MISGPCTTILVLCALLSFCAWVILACHAKGFHPLAEVTRLFHQPLGELLLLLVVVGGWGYNGDHTNLAGLLTDFAKTNCFTDIELISSPIFRKFDNATLHQTNLISVAQTELNKVMGDGIPATSFAAGANSINPFYFLGNIAFAPRNLIDWPAARKDGSRSYWLHSDICQLSFFYVYHVFTKIKEGDSQ